MALPENHVSDYEKICRKMARLYNERKKTEADQLLINFYLERFPKVVTQQNVKDFQVLYSSSREFMVPISDDVEYVIDQDDRRYFHRFYLVMEVDTKKDNPSVIRNPVTQRMWNRDQLEMGVTHLRYNYFRTKIQYAISPYTGKILYGERMEMCTTAIYDDGREELQEGRTLCFPTFNEPSVNFSPKKDLPVMYAIKTKIAEYLGRRTCNGQGSRQDKMGVSFALDLQIGEFVERVERVRFYENSRWFYQYQYTRTSKPPKKGEITQEQLNKWMIRTNNGIKEHIEDDQNPTSRLVGDQLVTDNTQIRVVSCRLVPLAPLIDLLNETAQEYGHSLSITWNTGGNLKITILNATKQIKFV